LHKERRDFVRRQNRGVRKICRGKRLKSPDRFSFTSWPKAGMLLTGGLLTLCWSLRKYNGNSPIPYAHKASLLTAVLAEVLHGLLCAASASASLRGSACSP